MKRPNRIIVIDDHPIVAQGIIEIARTCPGIGSVSLGHSGDTPHRDALYIIDLELGHGEENGFDIIEHLTAEIPANRILIYTMHEEPWVKAKICSLPIGGAVLKTEPVSLLREAMEKLLHGAVFFSPAFSRQRETHTTYDPATEISEREREVLKLLCQGYTSQRIAAELNLSINTIQTYRRRVMEKFNAANVAELIYQTKGFV